MTNKPPAIGEKEVLRIALDKKAADCFKTMASRMKEENPHIRVQPSAFVSFLVSDFFASYFEKDLGVLVAEFFDSKSYYEEQLQKAKSHDDFEKVMSVTLVEIKRIKGKARGKCGRPGRKPKQFLTTGGTV